MKLLTNYKRKSINEDRELEITFSIPAYQAKLIETLDKSKTYSLEIKEKKDDRTIKQNAYMWAIIDKIAKQEHIDEMDIYCNALEEANAKYIWLIGLPETKDMLLKNFRAVKITRYDEHKNAIFKCYIGSSKFDKEEMELLLEIVLKYAGEYGIDTDTLNYKFEKWRNYR